MADIPIIDELTGAVGTRAILAVSTYMQGRCESAKLKVMPVAHVGRDNMLIQLGELAIDLVSGSQHHCALFQGIVDGVATAVGHPTVGIGVAGTPSYLVVRAGMLAGQLSVVSRAAAVVILCADLVIRLGVYTCTIGVAIRGQLIDDVLQLDPVVA